jgi:hypothetical protein
MNNPGVFYFNFYFEDETNIVYGFLIKKSATEYFQKIPSLEDCDWYERIFDKLEGKYGVHDWSSSPTQEIKGIGYTSYEVEKSKTINLMKQWNQYFKKYIGEEHIGNVIQVPIQSIGNDLEIYKYCEQHS